MSMVFSERIAEKLGLAYQEDKDESELTEEERLVFQYSFLVIN